VWLSLCCCICER